MSSTSPLPPAPNAQRLAPLLPRLLWRELHLLAPLWIALYALGAILLLGFHMTVLSHTKFSDIVEMTLGVTGFSSAIFLVTSLLVTFAAERETQEDNFSIHRGLPPWPIFVTKTLLPLTMFLAMIAMLIITGFITANLRVSISLNDALQSQNYDPSSNLVPAILWLVYLTLITSAWTILCSLATRKVIHALLLTIAALIINFIYSNFVDEWLSRTPHLGPQNTFALSRALTFITSAFLPLIVTTSIFHYRTQLLELLSHLLLTRTPRPPKPIPLTTNPPPIETSTWKHLGWLHLREQYPLFIAAFVVTITAIIQPILSTYQFNQTFFGNMEKYPFYIASILFLLFSSALTFSPEHTHSSYRFWSDRGLSPTLIFRSRMLRYSLILLTTLGFSFILFTTTDAVINRNNSLLFAFDSGQLFHLDDTTKTATLFFAQYLLTAIPVGIFWSWICRQLIMSIVMTAFSMLFCFAYGNWASISNNWPYLVTHAPFLIAIIACLWTLFPERFQLQPRTRLWLLPTLAAPLALFISLGDILIYRVLEVPQISASLIPLGPAGFDRALVPEKQPFANQLRSIVSRLPKAPITANWTAQLVNHDFGGECYGWNTLESELRDWTEQQSSLANELETLLLNTPIEDMRLPLTASLNPNFNLGSLPDLLIYSAKKKEQDSDLAGALSAYTAADRFAEFMTLYNAAYITARIQLRARIARNLASYINHPDSHLEDLFPFLRISTDQLPDTPHWNSQLRRTFSQLSADSYDPEYFGSDLTQRSAQELWERFPIALLPTERWRYNRVLALWSNNLQGRFYQLVWLENLNRYEYFSVLTSSSEVLTDYHRQEHNQRLQASTPLFEIYKAQFDWLIEPYEDMKNDNNALLQLTNAQARLLMIYAERQTGTPITSTAELHDYYLKAQSRTPNETDKRIDSFLRFHQLQISDTSSLPEYLRQSFPENVRTINSRFPVNSQDLALPLPEIVPLTLASEH